MQPVWGLSASVTSVCRAFQTHPFINNQVFSTPLPFFSSRRCHRQVGGQVCPLIQNDNLPPEHVAWRHRFARLDRAEAAMSQSSKGQSRTPCSGAATGVRVSQRIMKLFVYGRRCSTFITRGWKEKLLPGEHNDRGRQWIHELSESLGLSYQSTHCEGLYSVKSKATRTIKSRFTDMGYIYTYAFIVRPFGYFFLGACWVMEHHNTINNFQLRECVVTLSELKSEETLEEASKDDVKTATFSPDYHNTAMQMSLFLSLQVKGGKWLNRSHWVCMHATRDPLPSMCHKVGVIYTPCLQCINIHNSIVSFSGRGGLRIVLHEPSSFLSIFVALPPSLHHPHQSFSLSRDVRWQQWVCTLWGGGRLLVAA